MIDSEMLRRAFADRIFAIHEPSLWAMLAALPARIEAGLQVEPARAARVRLASKGGAGSVAVIPIHGVIEQRGGFMSMFFGGVSCDMLLDQLRTAVNDPAVGAIVLDVDSPGGDVSGVDELAQEIYNASKQKPITAVSNCLCASAAYYLASQASELMASPSSLTGSIGVYTTHVDYSRACDAQGVTVSLIHYGENKTEGNPYEPLSDPAREHMQQMVDTFGQAFEKAVGRGRKVKADDVHKKFGQGRVFDAKKAVSLGMVDRVGTLDDALGKHGAARPSGMRGNAGIWVDFHAGAEKDTKRVGDKDCTKSCFAYRPDDNKENWKLPIECPDHDEEWEKSHIRNAISRWSSTDMPDTDEKSKARGRIKSAAKKHGIDVDDDSLARGECVIEGALFTCERNAKASRKSDVGDPDDDQSDSADDTPSDCACACKECKAGDCGACSHESCACEGCMCAGAKKLRKTKSEMLRRQIALATA